MNTMKQLQQIVDNFPEMEKIMAAKLSGIIKTYKDKNTSKTLRSKLATDIGKAMEGVFKDYPYAKHIKFRAMRDKKDTTKMNITAGNLWTMCFLNRYFIPFNKVPEFGSVVDPNNSKTYQLLETGECAILSPGQSN